MMSPMSDQSPTGPPSGPPTGPPSGPPALPPAGWYADPITGHGMRWWSGTEWTDQAMAGDQSPGLGTAGDMMGEAFRQLTDRAGHIFTILVAVIVPPLFITVPLTWLPLRGVEIHNFSQQGTDPAPIELTGLDAGGGIALGVAMVLNLFVAVWFAAAVTRQLQRAHEGNPEGWLDSVLGSARRLHRLIGSYVGLWLALLVVLTVGVIALSAFGAIAPVLLIALVPGMLIGFGLVFARLSLTMTAASVAPRGVSSFATSLRLSKGHASALFGRFLLLASTAIAVNLGGSILTVPVTSLGGVEAAELDADVLAMSDVLGDNPAAFGAAQLISGIVQAVSFAVVTAGSLVMYRRLSGPMADDLAAVDDTVAE